MTENEWLSSTDPQRMLEFLTTAVRGVTYHNPTIEEGMPLASDRKLRLFAVVCCKAVEDGIVCVRCNGEGRTAEIRDDKRKLFTVPASTQPSLLSKPCNACDGRGHVGALTDAQRVKIVFAEEEPWQEAASGSVHADYLSQDAITEYARTMSREQCINHALGWLGAPNASEVADQVSGWLQMLVTPPTQASLLREVFGNPWRPVKWWRMRKNMLDLGPGTHESWVPYDHVRPILEWKDRTVPRLAEAIYAERRFDDMPVLADALEEAGCGDEFILSHLRGMEPVPDEEMPNKYRWTKLRGPHVRGCWVLDLLLGKE